MKTNIIVEVPKNSQIKYEFNRLTGKISVDRILYGSYSYPMNYGFIEGALDWDGDELDALIISNQAFMPGVSVPVRVIGAVEMIDNGETDTKLITVIDCDRRYDFIQSLKDVPEHWLNEVKDFFENYKNLQNKKVLIKGFRGIEWAINEYNECVELMKKYGELPKEEFITKMKKEHPNKYPNIV